MKEDHMQNGQLKPGYNVQISTSNQFIVNYTIHPNPTDTITLKAHLEQHEASFGKTLKNITADAGYGSEENYELLKSKDIEAYVKYGMFDKQQDDNYNRTILVMESEKQVPALSRPAKDIKPKTAVTVH